MSAKKWLTGGALGLVAAFSFAALYRPEKIEVTGTMAEVGSVSNKLMEIGLRTREDKIIKFDVSSLDLLVPAGTRLSKDQLYQATADESLLETAWRKFGPRPENFEDADFKASKFAACPAVIRCVPPAR